MGACMFSKTMVGAFKTAEDAYRVAVERAIHDFGHDAYNGTISTTNGCRFYANAPKFGTESFKTWEETMLHEVLNKWEKCAAIEIKGKKLNDLKNRRGLKNKRGIKAYYFFGWAAE